MDGRTGYPELRRVPTRWSDNDLYGHVNNVIYYAMFDSVINEWLIEEGGLDIHEGEVIGVCAESHCAYREGFSYPEAVEVGLRVAELGRSSVRYELGVFREGGLQEAATGWFVHVFVGRLSRRPEPMPVRLRDALARLQPRESLP